MTDADGIPNGSGVVISLQTNSDEEDDKHTSDDNDDDDDLSNSGSSSTSKNSKDRNRLGADLFSY